MINHLSGWEWVPHDIPHVTAAAVIDPVQNQKIPPQPAQQKVLWKALEKCFGALVTELLTTPITFNFYRLHIGSNRTLSVVAYPDTDAVGRFKELMFSLFKAERWWEYPMNDGTKKLNHSVQAVVGHFEPDGSGDFPFLNVQDILQNYPCNDKICVNKIYLIQYTNRLINPKSDVIRCSAFNF